MQLASRVLLGRTKLLRAGRHVHLIVQPCMERPGKVAECRQPIGMLNRER